MVVETQVFLLRFNYHLPFAIGDAFNLDSWLKSLPFVVHYFGHKTL